MNSRSDYFNSNRFEISGVLVLDDVMRYRISDR